MFFDTFISLYKKKIGLRISDRQRFLGQGKANDYAEYKNHVGYVAGLEAALLALDELIKESENEDNE